MSEAPAMFSDGKAYERLMGRWSQVAGKVFLDWLALPKGLDWLDVGCGNGAFTETLIAHGAPAEVTGVDPSEGQLAYARTRPGAKLTKFQLAGAQELPFADKSFDAAIMALVISFVPRPGESGERDGAGGAAGRDGGHCQTWLGDGTAMVAAMSVLFAAHHWWSGTGNICSTFLLGVALMLAYRRLGALWPVMLAHYFMDIAAFV